MSSLRLTARTAVPAASVSYRFVRASGPGGQNVNKVATAVELRFALATAGLSERLGQRLATLAGNRLNQAGEIVIFAQRFRTQQRNRDDAFARLCALVAEAEHVPKSRVPTRPSRAAKTRRLETKGRHGAHKRLRRKPPLE